MPTSLHVVKIYNTAYQDLSDHDFGLTKQILNFASDSDTEDFILDGRIIFESDETGKLYTYEGYKIKRI